MSSNRVTFASAIGLAVLALFMLNGAEAATLNNPVITPDDPRVDGSQAMVFAIDYSELDSIFPDSFVVYFEGVSLEVNMECLSSGCLDDTDPNGTWTVVDISQPLANTLIANIGSDEISYNFRASLPGEDACYLACNAWVDSDVRVNTIPVLTDDAAVSGNDMPESTRTLTVTYTDADDHAGTVSAIVCDVSDVCEASFPLTKQPGGVDSDGAVYGADFETGLGGDLTATITASDGYDSAADNPTASFSVDTETPWLKNAGVSPTSAGEADDVTFTVTYCVFDDSTGTTVEVTVGTASAAAMSVVASNSDCKNGVDYSLTTTVAWANSAQTVAFSATNDLQSADDVLGDSVSINDAPVLSAASAERVADDAFNFSISATDANLDDTDTITVFVSIVDHVTEYTMIANGDGTFNFTVPEGDIIDEMGGIRTVNFRVADSWGDEDTDSSQTIDVTKTSSFVWAAPADGSFQPGFGVYSFDITNNGNYEDTFTVAAMSDNGWIASGSSSQMVTVAKGVTDSFTITMDVAHVAAGIVDSWSATATADNDDTQTESHDGQTTVASVSGVSVTIGTSTGSALPNGQVNYFFTITNTGNSDDDFTYSTNSANGWDLVDGAGATTLAMGASETITVGHTVVGNADSGDSDTITFTSGSASETATTTAEQSYGVSIAFDSSTDNSLVPGSDFTVTYTVTNTGNGDDSFSVFFESSWLSGSGSTTLNLGGGLSGTVTASFMVPSDAASGSSSSISAYVNGGGSSSDTSGSVTKTVSADTRSATISTNLVQDNHNAGDSTTGTLTITNTGVVATFVVSAMDDALNFGTSTITLAAGVSGDLAFTVSAITSGDVSFTVKDTIDQNEVSGSFAMTVNTFDSALLTDITGDCGESNIACATDAAGGWSSASNSYTNAGTFFTTMIVTDSNGIEGTHTFSTTIANSNPSASVAMDVGDATAGSPQTFIFSVPTDSDGTIIHMVVEFGDGNSVTISEFTGNTVSVEHTYEVTGDMEVTATVYDNSGGNTVETTSIDVGDRTVEMGPNSYLYNFVFLIGLFLLGAVLAGTSFKMQQGEIAGDEEMNERDRQRLESVERRMESLSEREELLEVSAYDASRAATKLEEHITAFNEILVKAQEIAATEKLKELEAAEEASKEEEEQIQLDLEDPDIEMVAERFHSSLAKLVNARSELSKIEEQLAHILKMERDEQLEKLTEMSESYETTKRKIDALQTSAEARDAAAVENNIMNLLSAAASGGSVGGADFGDFGNEDDEEYEVEIYEDEDGSFYYIDPDTGEEVPCDEDGNAL